MKRLVIIILTTVFAAFSAMAQDVTNVAFRQVNKKVEVTYTLDKTANITLSVSTDGGKTFSAPLEHVTGDVGNNVTPGNKTIIWDALEDVDKIVGSQIVFKVTAGSMGKQTFTVNGVSFTMIYVQGGTFTMGATSEQGSDAFAEEKPAHSVTLSSFSIGETEVTQAMWKAVMGKSVTQAASRLGKNTNGVGSNYPMYYISWNDCQEFIRKLNRLTGKNFRLPTEAEWEYAARGGNKTLGYKYSGSNNIGEVAWYCDNSAIHKTKQTHPVKQKQANELGIYDMTGNVYEYCYDAYDINYYSSGQSINPKNSSREFLHRVIRGGSWYGTARFCRSSYRGNVDSNYKSNGIGLRLALSE